MNAIAIFNHGILLKKTLWQQEDLNLRRRYQSADLLIAKPTGGF